MSLNDSSKDDDAHNITIFIGDRITQHVHMKWAEEINTRCINYTLLILCMLKGTLIVKGNSL